MGPKGASNMAEMIPDHLPERNFDGQRITAGERRVFQLLKRLPDDCLVYYEPVVSYRYPDFIVILPEVGLLVIEVKGWWFTQLTRANPNSVVLDQRGKEVPHKHPGRQARAYMNDLMDKCRQHPHANQLLHLEGPYKNNLAFPRSYVSVLSNVNRSQLDNGSQAFTDIFPPRKTITKDRLAIWETLDSGEFLAELKSYFESWFPFPKLASTQIDVIRSIIHPEVILRQTGNDLAVLDLRQERNARRIGGGHRVIYGVAGSGKTVLLIARAKLLADQGKSVLLLCYNRLLASYLSEAVKDHKTIIALNFHSWGGRNGARFRDNERKDAYAERLLTLLRKGATDFAAFDAVLIDESQDWDCSWFHCAKRALKDPENGDLLLVGDGSQALYRTRPFTWADAGIRAAGRTLNKRLDLDCNYRNTVEILQAAQLFSATGRRNQNGDRLPIVPVDPDRAIRNGPEPSIVELDSGLDECHYAAALIECWIRGGVEIRGRRERISPCEIAILYPRIRQEQLMSLIDRLQGFTTANWLTAKGNDKPTLQADGVRILTVKASRGLQFKAVIILWADLLPFQPQDDERSELYVAMTRAEDVLIILHSGHSDYTEELQKHIYSG